MDVGEHVLVLPGEGTPEANNFAKAIPGVVTAAHSEDVVNITAFPDLAEPINLASCQHINQKGEEDDNISFWIYPDDYDPDEEY